MSILRRLEELNGGRRTGAGPSAASSDVSTARTDSPAGAGDVRVPEGRPAALATSAEGADPGEPVLAGAGGRSQEALRPPHGEKVQSGARVMLEVIRRLAADAARSGSEGLAGEEREALRRIVEERLAEVLEEENRIVARSERRLLVEGILNEVLGLGPIEPLLSDPSVSEVMVNGPDLVFVERNGMIEETDVRFRDHTHVLQTIERIVAPLGRHIDESSPMVDARLSDGSRVNAVIPPVSVHGPVLTIRKFAADPLRADDLVRLGTWSAEMASFLKMCVEGKANIVVSGGTGTGKTTTLNVLSSFIPSGERIVTIEDAAELQLQQRHVVTMETRPPNVEGRGRISIRDLVINALRMRPDRIVVGEVRGGEALDMLQAMNTGHEGSLTTAHANSPRDMLSRLETMVLMAGTDLPVRAIREQMASSIDLIVHLSRMRDGSRRVTQITEVVGIEGEVVTLQDIFLYEHHGCDGEGRVRGRFRPTGIVPGFLEEIDGGGAGVDAALFSAL